MEIFHDTRKHIVGLDRERNAVVVEDQVAEAHEDEQHAREHSELRHKNRCTALVLTAPRMPPRIARASSRFPTESQGCAAMRPVLVNTSNVSVAASTTRVVAAIPNGTGSRLVPGTTLWMRANRLLLIMLSLLRRFPPGRVYIRCAAIPNQK